MQNEKKMKRNLAKRSEKSESKRNKRSKGNKAKISEKNILKRNEGENSLYLFSL
jgi:hypothetical protein